MNANDPLGLWKLDLANVAGWQIEKPTVQLTGTPSSTGALMGLCTDALIAWDDSPDSDLAGDYSTLHVKRGSDVLSPASYECACSRHPPTTRRST